MHLVCHTRTQCPKSTDRLLALLFFYFSIHTKKNDKHAQGCPLVVGHVIAPQTAEHQELEKGGQKKKQAGVDKLASGEPVHQDQLYTNQ